MATKREYLKSQGITVGARGRFSGAAKQALQEATQKGLTFTDEKSVKVKPFWVASCRACFAGSYPKGFNLH